ncbi:MAG: DedA family protein [Betaproteobacteria bacterium]|nr:DedA family protein [Betaproteobacteria bacterium]
MTPLDPTVGLGGLFAASFLAATLLPGGSELALLALLKLHPDQVSAALAVATLGNTLGGLSTYGLARLVPAASLPRRADWVERHGAATLLLAWLPGIGDALCAAAGWLRLPLLRCGLFMALGKGLRYGAICFWA